MTGESSKADSANNTKRVLVTGASKGIGNACAQWFAEQGHKVAVHYRSGKEAAEEFCQRFDQCEPFAADLADPDAQKKLIDDVCDSFGGIDVLVNNAGMSLDKILLMAKPEDLDRIMKVNVTPVMNLTKLATKKMLKQRWGRVIQVTSVVGHTGNGGQSLYSLSKGAVSAFTKSAAQELAKAGITINCVAPGFIKTAMTDALSEDQQAAILAGIPMKRIGDASEIAACVGFLASDGASYVTGSTLHVNGGMYCA